MADKLQWLTQLERQAAATSDKLTGLERENKSLKARIRKLEKESAGGPTQASWAKERRVVQERLTRLAGHLEELL